MQGAIGRPVLGWALAAGVLAVSGPAAAQAPIPLFPWVAAQWAAAALPPPAGYVDTEAVPDPTLAVLRGGFFNNGELLVSFAVRELGGADGAAGLGTMLQPFPENLPAASGGRNGPAIDRFTLHLGGVKASFVDVGGTFEVHLDHDDTPMPALADGPPTRRAPGVAQFGSPDLAGGEIAIFVHNLSETLGLPAGGGATLNRLIASLGLSGGLPSGTLGR